MAEWLSVYSLHGIACRTLHDSIDATVALDLERIDFRPEKGMVKFVFIDQYWGVQLDCATGAVLHLERRGADLVENIHDGSILDYAFDTGCECFKLAYTTVMGLVLLLFTITGFWLWYGPKRMRRTKYRN